MDLDLRLSDGGPDIEQVLAGTNYSSGSSVTLPFMNVNRRRRYSSGNFSGF